MSGSDLRDLAHRLAEATGPDWGLDAAIEGLLGEWADAPSIHVEAGFEGTRAEFLHQHSPRYTGDLQACSELMRAVLPGWGYTLRGELDTDQAACALWHSRAVTRISRAPTAPLAWLRAIVAAVMAREKFDARLDDELRFIAACNPSAEPPE